MDLTILGELPLLLCVILLYNTATAERTPIPVNISCHPPIHLDKIFSQSIQFGNTTITVDKDKPGVTSFSDLWNISVTGTFSRKPYLEGKGHLDCSLVNCDIMCVIYGYFHGNKKYKRHPYTPHIEYGVVRKPILKTPQMLTCQVVSGPPAREMRWQNLTGGRKFEDIATVTKHENDTCLTTSELRYGSNIQAQYRCMFGEIEVDSIRIYGIDLSFHFFLSSMITVYAPFLLHQSLLSTGRQSPLTSKCSAYSSIAQLMGDCMTENALLKLKEVWVWIPLTLCVIFALWWTILFWISRDTDYLPFVMLEVICYLLHAVAHIFCSLQVTNWSPLDKWKRVLCFLTLIIPFICWVMMRATPLETVWCVTAVACSILQVRTQF